MVTWERAVLIFIVALLAINTVQQFLNMRRLTRRDDERRDAILRLAKRDDTGKALFLGKLDEVATGVKEGGETGARIELEQRGVKHDLAESYKRADAVTRDQAPGRAADAAMRKSSDKE